MLYLLLAIAIGIGVTVYLIKKGKIKDSDGDFIPDVIEDKVEDIKEDVEEIVDKVKDKVEDIKEDVEEFVEEVKDLPAKVRRRKPGPKKTNKPANPAPRTNTSKGGGGRVESKPTSTPDAVLKVDKHQK